MFSRWWGELAAFGRLALMASLLVLAAVLLVNAALHHPPRPAPCPARPSGCAAPGHVTPRP